VGLWNFIEKIAKGTFNTAVQSVDFVTDIAQEALPGRDEYEGSGIADTIWGSFNDNVLGEGGVMQSAIGPEGVGGTIIGAISPAVRKPIKSVIDPTFKAATVAVKQAIDRPLGTLMTIASVADSSGEGTHNEYEFEGGLSNWFNTETWAHAWDISNSQSLGQALSLAVGTKDILDKDEVDKWEGTSMHRLASGTTDALFTIIYDPFYQIGVPTKVFAPVVGDVARVHRMRAGAGTHVTESAGFARLTKDVAAIADEMVEGRTAAASGASRTLAAGLRASADEAKKTLQKGVDETGQKLDDAAKDELQGIIDEADRLEDLASAPLGFSEGYYKGLPTPDDLTLIDELATKVHQKHKHIKGFTPDVAYAVAASPTLEARQLVFRLAMGDAKALQQVRNLADEWAGLMQQGGLVDRMVTIQKQIDSLTDSIASPGLQQKLRANLNRQVMALEKEAADLLRGMPQGLTGLGVFNAAFSIKGQRLSALAPRFADEVSVDAVDAAWGALNDSPRLVSGVADEILGPILAETASSNRMVVGSLREAPKIGIVRELGYGVTSFMSQVPMLGPAGLRVVNVFREKSAQQMMIWDDVDQTFNQFERMLRDASRVTHKGRSLVEEAGVNVDEVLGRWVKSSQYQRKAMFENIVDDLNDGVIKLYADELLEGIDADTLKSRPLTKGRMREALDEAEGVLRGQAENARVYGNRDLQFDLADTDFNITRRYIENLTPQQLRQASLVPRYDAIATVMKHSAIRKFMGRGAELGDEFMMAWKKSVLLRPAWPIRVLSDELLRSAAALGGMHTMRGTFAGFNDLRTAWFKKNGEDVFAPVIAKMRDDLKVGDELSDGDLYLQYEAKHGAKATEKLTRNAINDAYGRNRIVKRTGATTALGIFALGPGGALASAALYSLYARRTMSSLARREVAARFYSEVRGVAKKQFDEAEAAIRQSVKEGVRTPEEAARLLNNLKHRKDLAETQARTLKQQLEHSVLRTPKRKDADLTEKYDLPEEYSEMITNFDRVGELMHQARVGGYYMGGYQFANEFGDTPFAVQMNKQALSSSRSTRGAYETVGSATKRNYESQIVGKEYRLHKFDQNRKAFVEAYDRTVNYQFKPHLLDDTMPQEFQMFTQMFWQGRSDAEIIAWLKTRQGSKLEEAMPRHFGKEQNIEQWVNAVRTQIDNYVPNTPEFALVRQKLAEGKDISWVNDIVPILNKNYGGVNAGVKAIHQLEGGRYAEFGIVHGASGAIADAVITRQLIQRATKQIDSWMESLGTMTVDNLSRSTVFSGVYRNELARLVQTYRRSDGTYRITDVQLKSIENAARRVALDDTRKLLYDLAERTRFGEMVGMLMPFYSAWQEVITRWAGLAVQNPVFVARGARYFQAIKGEDEEGNSNFVIRMPEGLLGAEIAGQPVFGKLGTLGFTSLKLHPDSISMISAGLPGFGPIVTIAASESVIAQPSLQESMDWLLPYGASEGTSVFHRMWQQVEPTFLRRMEGAYFDVPERQKMLAQVSIDLAAQYEGNGIKINTPELEKEFVDEAIRRTEDILKIRALAGLGVPFAFQVQSPYHAVIEDYRKVTEEDGFDAATTWLLANHPELWAITARRTMVQGVASATLEGDAKYREHKDFADAHPEIGDFIIGKIGADDVQFEFNYAVYKSEIAEGRRVRATPQEIMRKPEENRGWAEWREAKNLVYEELARREQAGGSASLGAKANNDLQMLMDRVKLKVAQDNPGWWEAYNETYDQLHQAKVMDGFRALIKSEDFQYRPEIPLLDEYFEARELIEKELERRGNASGEADAYSLGYRTNADLEQLWDAVRVKLRNNNDFIEIFDRYFENDTIDKKTWVNR
tara:strand:+ start:7247 stop:12760 length:5514 start_codon:yes stop_codon:yes gene_type:complete